MDPTQILLQALSLGQSAAGPIGDQVIKDAYAGLRSLIFQKFGAKHAKLDERLSDYADDPETYEKPAKKAISDAGVEQDQEVIDRATELLKLAESKQPGITGGLIGQINAAGGRVVVTGGNQSGTINMSDTYHISGSATSHSQQGGITTGTFVQFGEVRKLITEAEGQRLVARLRPYSRTRVSSVAGIDVPSMNLASQLISILGAAGWEVPQLAGQAMGMSLGGVRLHVPGAPSADPAMSELAGGLRDIGIEVDERFNTGSADILVGVV